MISQNYAVNQYLVSNLLSMVQTKEIAIPEIQRPFVWEPDKVTELIDSLYNGYPIGYIITWQSPDVKLKDGNSSAGKKILIDGQQRITALRAAILGETVKNIDYADVRIQVAYNPLEHKFATLNAAISKDPVWIKDIAPLLNGSVKASAARKEYLAMNPSVDEDVIEESIENLKSVANRQIGVIELSGELDIERVTEIFIRINSKGVPLNQADFVMSTIAANENYGGNLLRKCIDHFSELAVRPEFYSVLMENDREFAESPYRPQVDWLRNENDDIYDPEYGDMLRVSFMHQFHRGKLADLVSLLSGRDFKTKEFREDIVADSYQKLDQGLLNFMNQYNFDRFVLAIKGAGFCSSKLLNSAMTMDFAYTLYLLLLNDPVIPNVQIKRYVQKWFVLSSLTSRYIGSPESQMDRDMRSMEEKGFLAFLEEVEASALSDTFWSVTLPQNLETSAVNSPVFNVFLAAQIRLNANSLLMNGTKVSDLIAISGDIHHIFPRAYLKKNGVDSKTKYNQVANYIYLDTQINKAISDSAPCDYFKKAFQQCESKVTSFGNITDTTALNLNLEE